MITLYTFAVSHFSEKARWALEFEGIAFEDRFLLPGPHMWTTRRLARRTSVPILVDGNNVIQGSSAILDHAQRALGATRLQPKPDQQLRSAELEALADNAFGRGVQSIAYGATLADRALVTRLWAQGGSRWAASFYGLAYPVIAHRIRRMYKATPEGVQTWKDRFRAALDTFDRELGRDLYFGGEGPNRLDITVAALLAPLWGPPEHLVDWPKAHPGLKDFTRELDERPMVQHMWRMYRDHRKCAPAEAERTYPLHGAV